MKKVVVIGGGITGLAAAYGLQKAAGDSGGQLTVTLLEASSRLGGKIKTVRRDGYAIDTGPDSILRTKPWAVNLARELGLEKQMVTVPPSGRRSYVLRGGRLLPIPPGIMRPGRQHLKHFLASPLLSWRGKLRLVGEWFVPPQRIDGDESLGRFITRRLGGEALDYLIEPLLAGIYAGDAHALSLAATFPHFKQMEKEHGGILRAALAQKDQGTAPASASVQAPPSPFINFRGGLAVLTDALAAALTGVDVRLKAAVRQITCQPNPEGDGRTPPATGSLPPGGTKPYTLHLDRGKTIAADGVIIAVPAFAAAQLLGDLNPTAAKELQAIHYGSVMTVALGYRSEDLAKPLTGSGYIVPTKEVDFLTACTWVSSKWPQSAPADGVLIRGHIGRVNLPPPLAADDEAVVASVAAELARVLHVKASPRFSIVTRWPQAMPQYGLGHQQRVDRIRRLLAGLPALTVAGAAYGGVGIPDCVRQGLSAAEEVTARLGLSVLSA